MANINWFPGHMAKSLRELKTEIAKCDYFIETCDARLPLTSRNPEFAKLWQKKRGLLLLTKSDLADAAETEKWLTYFKEQGHAGVLAANLMQKQDIKKIEQIIKADNQEIIRKAKLKGRRIKPVRIMINGIPNTGKSTLINKLSGKNAMQASNRPGVTRSISRLRAGTDFELTDTPGILWPKLETTEEQLKLAASGAIKDDVLPMVEVACGLLMILCQLYPVLMQEKFDLPEDPLICNNWLSAYQNLEHIAYKLNLIRQGNEPDHERTARHLLTQYRQGKLGRLSLESAGRQIILPTTL